VRSPASAGIARAAPSRPLASRIARDELRRVRNLTRTIDGIEHELAGLVAQLAPQLLAEPGCGVLIAATLLGEIAGIDRSANDAKLARTAGSPPAQDEQHDTASTAAATAN
jgi:transposase